MIAAYQNALLQDMDRFLSPTGQWSSPWCTSTCPKTLFTISLMSTLTISEINVLKVLSLIGLYIYIYIYIYISTLLS